MIQNQSRIFPVTKKQNLIIVVMRFLLLLFLFLSPISFSQEEESNLKDQLAGTWWLNAVQVEQFVDNESDKISSGVSSNYSVTFWKDSVFFRDPGTRFYKRPEPDFTYSLTYDSILKTNSLHLFRGKGKHRKKVFGYNFRLVNGELILSNYSELDPNIPSLGQINYYTYSRYKDAEKLYEKILGEWINTNYNAPDEKIPDTLIYVKKTNAGFYPNGVPCSFKRDQGETKFQSNYSYSLPPDESGIIDGVYTVIKCSFVIRKNQLIFDGKEPLVFDILELTDEKMRLVRRKEQ